MSTQATAKHKTSKTPKSSLPRFGVSCSVEDLRIMDLRAASLGLDRSSYLVQLARQDYLNRPTFVLIPKEQLVIPDK